MFTPEERDQTKLRLIEKARNDPRIVAAAEMGSVVAGLGDRWSDVDLTFGVAAGLSRDEVIEAWTEDLTRDENAVHLFDLPLLSTMYRVFLFPGSLQIDLSFTPESDFGPLGPKWKTLFGATVERTGSPPLRAEELVGEAVHAALRARVTIERSQPWAAELWISELRDKTLSLACLQRELPPKYARGIDQLPAELLKDFEAALVPALDRETLLRTLRAGIDLLLREAPPALIDPVRASLLELQAEEIV